jgi:hypothetical protein
MPQVPTMKSAREMAKTRKLSRSTNWCCSAQCSCQGVSRVFSQGELGVLGNINTVFKA